jgi:hypothetical protein
MSYTSPFTGDVVQPTDVSYESITLTANLQLVWPINGNLSTDTPAARIMEVDATAASLELRMPQANQVSVGQDALIKNVGAEDFTVTTYDGASTILTITSGTARYIYLTNNGNEEGTWANFEFGAGTSSADAATLAGAGLLASGLTLNQSHPVESIIASQSFVDGDRAKTYVWGGGTTTVTLPSALAVGDSWFMLLKNNGTGTLTLDAPSTQTIDGTVTKAFQPNESAFIVSTGTEFITVGYGVSTQFEFGVLTKTVTTGTYTLTANEAANSIQIYNGTLSGNVTIIVPPVVNLYIISNQCSAPGAETLTISTGAVGANTATVPSSGQVTVFCDGTNILNANTTQAGGTAFSLVNGSAASPSLNFGSETNTGVYRPGAGRFGISVLGNLILDVDAGGINVTGDIVATGNVDGVDGTFTGNMQVTGTGNFEGGISGGTF